MARLPQKAGTASRAARDAVSKKRHFHTCRLKSLPILSPWLNFQLLDSHFTEGEAESQRAGHSLSKVPQWRRGQVGTCAPLQAPQFPRADEEGVISPASLGGSWGPGSGRHMGKGAQGNKCPGTPFSTLFVDLDGSGKVLSMLLG